MFSDLNFSPEELEAADKLVGFNLIVPKTAVVKGSRSSWMEYVVVEEASREEKISSKGSQHTVFTLKAKVIPGPGVESGNIGRYKTEWFRVNPGAMKGRTDTLGSASMAGQITMSALSLKKLRQIAAAAGLDLSVGLTNEVLNALFPEDGQSVLLGQKLAVTITEDSSKKDDKGESQQEFSAILKAPEGI
jgi:hypothetical protein